MNIFLKAKQFPRQMARGLVIGYRYTLAPLIGLNQTVLMLPHHSPYQNSMSEDRDLIVPDELERRVDLRVPPPNRDHTEDRRVNELEGEQPGLEQPRGEDSAA